MPAAIVPIVEVIAAAVGTAGTVYSLANRPSAPSTPPAAQTQAAQAQQDTQQEQQLEALKAQLVRKNSATAQSQVGGALTDQGFSALVAELTGNPGDANFAARTLFGPSGGTGVSGTGLAAPAGPVGDSTDATKLGLTDALRLLENPGNSGSSDFSLTQPYGAAA